VVGTGAEATGEGTAGIKDNILPFASYLTPFTSISMIIMFLCYNESTTSNHSRTNESEGPK
jgi:hypothetical protein